MGAMDNARKPLAYLGILLAQSLLGGQAAAGDGNLCKGCVTTLTASAVKLTDHGEPELAAAMSGEKVVVTSGTPGNIYLLDLTSKVTKTNPRPGDANGYSGYGQDTVIARLRDGHFLLSAAGNSHTECGWAVIQHEGKTKFDSTAVGVVVHPDWWNWPDSDKPHDSPRNGLRSAEVMWRSLDGESWDQPSALDAGVVAAVGSSGATSQGYCAPLAPGFGGFDRPELYSNPFGDRVFMTTECATPQGWSIPLFVSHDAGQTWADSTIRLNGQTPAVMTASASRLFIAQ